MKFNLTIELGNDLMRTSRHLKKALAGVGERVMAAIPQVINREESGRIRDDNGNTVGEWNVVKDVPAPKQEVGPSITQLAFEDDDMEKAEQIAKRLGYKQTAYTSSSDMWGLFCLPDRPTQKKGCIIKTKQFGLMFVQDMEDMLMSDLQDK